MSNNLPDCTGCTDPDPFDRNSDGVTHQMGTKQHQQATDDGCRLCLDLAGQVDELEDKIEGLESELAALRKDVATPGQSDVDWLNIDQDAMQVAPGFREMESLYRLVWVERDHNRQHLTVMRFLCHGVSEIIAAHCAPIRASRDEAVGLLRDALGTEHLFDWRLRVRAFLTRHQRDNAQGEG